MDKHNTGTLCLVIGITKINEISSSVVSVDTVCMWCDHNVVCCTCSELLPQIFRGRGGNNMIKTCHSKYNFLYLAGC